MSVLNKTESIPNMITGATSSFTNLNVHQSNGLGSGYGLSLNVVVNTPSNATFTAIAATDVCTAVANGFTTGLKVQLTTTTTLPAGLALATDYFIVVLTSDTFKLATSLANALAGTIIDITDAGTGVHTVAVTALAGASYKIQASIDSISWVDIAAATPITVSITVLAEKLTPLYAYLQVVYLITAGRMSIVQNLLIKT